MSSFDAQKQNGFVFYSRINIHVLLALIDNLTSFDLARRDELDQLVTIFLLLLNYFGEKRDSDSLFGFELVF